MLALRNQNLVAYWKLTESSGDRLDSGPAGLTLTDTNTVTSGAGPGGDFTVAAQFTAANSERLTRASDASTQMGDIAQTVVCWVKMDTKTANCNFLTKGPDGGAAGEYLLYYRQATDRLGFRVWRIGGSQQLAVANTLGSPSTGVWYFLLGQYDPTGASLGVVGVSVNNGTLDTLSAAEDRQAATSDVFNLGSTSTPALFHNGMMCGVGMWKRLLTAAEKAWLYNNGTPKSLF